MQAPDERSDAISLWDCTAPAALDFPPLDLDVETQVAIVGGGFTGISAALHLAEKGIDCRVLEARNIGHGGSGRNVGLVNAGIWLPPQYALRTLGERAGRRLVDVLGAAPQYVFSLIERHQIDCEAIRKGTIHAAHSRKGLQDLHHRVEEWRGLGVSSVELLDRNQAAAAIGCDEFFGGLLDHRAGTINPMGYVRGLARAASNDGALIHTGTRVTKLSPGDGAWRLHTATGTVTAQQVILGTNAYTDELWPGLARTFTPIHYFQVATEPLGARAAAILPGGQGVWDTGSIMFSFRKDRSGRLLFGSMGKLVGSNEGISRRWAQKALARLFPELGPVGWEQAWHGRIALTSDHLPRIHRLAANLYTPIGFNGRGITPGTVFGKAIADLLTGMPEQELPLPITQMRRDLAAPWKAALLEAAFKTYRLYKSF